MRTGRRWGLYVVVVLAGVILANGCSRNPSDTPSTHSGPWSMVTLGDSVPAGTACGCAPYPELTASALTVPGSREVTATNDAVGGFTSANVLAQLRAASDVVADVTRADIVAIEVGANDVAYSASCKTSAACYQPKILSAEQNLAGIVEQVRELTEGHPVVVVLLDYWNVWLGGRYAEAKGPAYVQTATALTDRVNSVIRQTAAATGSAYADLRAAFKGPNYTYDETHYLASDGDHPNAAGHRRIADTLVTVITKTLHS